MRALWLVVLAGCSPGGDKFADTADTGGNLDTTQTDYDTDDAETDTPGAASATWWSVQGTLVVAGGVVDPALSALEVTLHAASGAPLCVVAGPPVAVADAPLPDPGLLSWWEVTPASEATYAPYATYGPCTVPASLVLGIGPYDAALDPAAAAAGLTTTGLNGLYTASGDELWVFGVAGSPAQFSEDADALTVAPLPDGELYVTGLHLLPL